MRPFLIWQNSCADAVDRRLTLKRGFCMDGQLVQQILELLYASQTHCPELHAAAESGNTERFLNIYSGIYAEQTQLLPLIPTTENAGSKRLLPAVQSILDTLRRIEAYYPLDRSRCLQKIEFELLPLLQEAYQTGYFFWYVAGHPERMKQYYETEKNLLGGNSYIDEAIETGHYKYDLSIFVLAYNKLEYTRQCVDSLLKNIPAGLRYELILLNHGSTDGTREYFESLHPHKQLDIAVNGGGMWAFNRIVEGEFTMQISNDVLILSHTIENLLSCIRSDPKIAFVVPTTPNVSNLQTIPANYNTLEELISFAQTNNRCDPCRWEQRVRLCNPIDIRRNSVFCSSSGLCPELWYHTADPVHWNSFPDDRISLLLRRNGYKLMLAKDAYCHHFGSVTLKDEIHQQNEQKYYLDGRREVIKAFGVDPWGIGFCYDTVFMKRIVEEQHDHVEILGINCGLGSNSLKIKEQLKEYCHNTDVNLHNITDDVSFLPDLYGVSDAASMISSIRDFKALLQNKIYQYIVWEAPFLTKHKFKTLLSACLSALSSDGKLILKLTDQSSTVIKGSYPKRTELGNNWVVLKSEGTE